MRVGVYGVKLIGSTVYGLVSRVLDDVNQAGVASEDQRRD